MTITKDWFDDDFTKLHPLIQELHTNGGSLAGDVNIKLGKNLAGLIGKRLANKLNIPTNREVHSLRVIIKHTNNDLHWSRCFDDARVMNSVFTPVGNITSGYWVEKTGPIQLSLKVSIRNQGWYWQPIKAKINGIPFPMLLLPKTEAYKYIEAGKYRFYVGFSFFMLGTILSYSGLLTPDIEENECDTKA